jgi:hypothetical protein
MEMHHAFCELEQFLSIKLSIVSKVMFLYASDFMRCEQRRLVCQLQICDHVTLFSQIFSQQRLGDQHGLFTRNQFSETAAVPYQVRLFSEIAAVP